MASSLKKKILKTIAYADVFDYPLTEQELWRFLITSTKTSRKRVFLIKKDLVSRIILESQGLHFFNWRKDLCKVRKSREKTSKRKIRIAEKIAGVLKFIPWVKMLGVTGTLARGNAKRDDDIDFIIVTSKNRLWLARFLVTLVVELSGRRRRPNDVDIKDKICLNMFLDEAHLAVPKKERNLFTAYEVVQFKPLWSKDKVYERFLRENQWVERYLANAAFKIKKKKEKRPPFFLIWGFSLFQPLVSILERMVKLTQLWYMRKRRTTETISSGRLLFHPKDAKKKILAEYEKRLKRLGIKNSS